MPSSRVYRGSLVALLVASVFAVWLLVSPPAAVDRDQPPASIGQILGIPTATPVAVPTVESTASPTPVLPTAAATVGVTTAVPVATEAATETAAALPTATAAPTSTTVYTVESGDSLSGIAAAYLPEGRDLLEFEDEIAERNEIEDKAQIFVGQELEIPGQ